MNKGITLVILIITIVVTLILTSTVFMVFTQNEVVDVTKETVFKENMKLLNEELDKTIANRRLKNRSFDKQTVNATNNNLNNDTDIKTWIPSITDEYISNLQIIDGKLYYIGTENANEIAWATDLDMMQIPVQE